MLKTNKGCFCAALFLLLFVSINLDAQRLRPGSGFLEVVDVDNKPVVGAKIRSFGKNRSVFLTNEEGKHETRIRVDVSKVPKPRFSIEKAGFHTVTDYFDVFEHLKYGRRTRTPLRIVLLRSSEDSSQKEKDEQAKREMFAAVAKGDSEKVRELLKAGVKANLRTGDLFGIPIRRSTPLVRFATRSGDWKTVVELLQAGATLNSKENGTVLLQYLTRGPLLTKAPDDKEKQRKIKEDFERGAVLIIDSGVDFKVRDRKGLDALLLAARKGYLSILEELIAQRVSLVSTDRRGHNVLIHLVNGEASLEDKIIGAELLVANGVDVNRGVKRRRSNPCLTPLRYAVFRGEETLVSQLLAMGADPNLKCRGGRTLLDDVMRGSIKDAQTKERMIEILSSAGAMSRRP